MKTTLTAIRADIGSIGGHLAPGARSMAAMDAYISQRKGDFVVDYWIGYTGDDITVLCTHRSGPDFDEVRRLVWNAFTHAAGVAEEDGLYGAGQDVFKEGTSGVAKGLGPAVAEVEFEERANEAFLLFSVDKTVPGALNLPLYLAFADPMHCPGLILSPRMRGGFRFEIMDVAYREYDRMISLDAPEELYSIAALLRDPERFAIRGVFSRSTGEQAVAVSTTRVHNVSGILLGKNDPVAVVRVQDAFPASGEVLEPYGLGPFVGGFMRGSLYGPLMPVRLDTGVSYLDGPPVVSCAAFSLRQGRLTPPVDAFDHPFWDSTRHRISEKAIEIRRQGFFSNAMLPYESLAYGGIVKILRELDERFVVEKPSGS
ncbi:MAG: fructose 1,6-bisphosphatase [Desulfobacterales bacterium]